MATDNDVLVVLYVKHGHIDPAKQESAMLRYASARGYKVVGLCFNASDCAALVASGRAALVLAVDVDPDLDHGVRAAGGEVEWLRRGRGLPNAQALLQRMWRRGYTAQQMADLLETTTGDLVAILARMGIKLK